ncbi:zf-HC2 domain-containing protein [Thermosyntropha sp.]|uniref:anti-sigma factor family protein n=1 Tax=Thermosyntropha sp. TaxID=2740820 RepID=UPI0025EDF8B3|nr:zf-HC2 domain-containing protein [Thermosyntropha sp.]MBO8158488.1 zf-HC2 domain-containing protein [Thermosyntropha sp.]
MNCKKIKKYWLDYAEDNLPPELKKEIDAHIKNCDICQKNLVLTRLENSILKDTSNIPEIRPDFTENLLKMVDSFEPEKNSESSSFKNSKAPIYALTAVITCIIFILLIPGVNSYIKTLFINEKVQISDIKNNPSSSQTKKEKLVSLNQVKLEQTADLKKEFRSTPAEPKDQITMTSSCIDDKVQNGTTYSQPDDEKIPETRIKNSKTPNNKPPLWNLTGLPEEYILKKAEQTANNEAVYIYFDTQTQNLITIKLVLIPDEVKSSSRSLPTSSISSENVATFGNENNNYITKIKVFNNEKYNLTIEGTVNSQELKSIAENIKIDK